MTWDEDARWFAYRDPAAAYARESYEEPEYEPEETEAEPPAQSAPPVADKSVMEDELYYTEAATKT